VATSVGYQSGSILGVLPGHADRVCIESILAPSNWQLRLALTFQQFQAAQFLTPSPAVIVVSRLADDHLWVDVLNFAGFDLLWKPLNPKEVVHSANMASRHWSGQALPACAARAERL